MKKLFKCNNSIKCTSQTCCHKTPHEKNMECDNMICEGMGAIENEKHPVFVSCEEIPSNRISEIK